MRRTWRSTHSSHIARGRTGARLDLLRGDFLEGFMSTGAGVRRVDGARKGVRDAATQLLVTRAAEQLAVTRYVEAQALARRA